MIVSFFEKKASLIILFLLGLLIWFNPLFINTHLEIQLDSPLLKLCSLNIASSIIYQRITFLFLVLFIFLMATFGIPIKNYGIKVHFGLFVFVIVTGYELLLIQSNLGFFAVILFVVVNFILVVGKPLTPSHAFLVGMLMGISCLIVPVLLYFVPIIYFVIISMRVTDYRVYVTFLLGILAILILFVTIAFMMGKQGVVHDTAFILFYIKERPTWNMLYRYMPGVIFLCWAVIEIIRSGRFMKKTLLRYYELQMFQIVYCFALLLIFPQTLAVALPMTIMFASTLINQQFSVLKGKYLPWVGVAYLLIACSIPYLMSF